MHIMVLHSSVTNRRIFVNVFGKMGGARVHVCAEEEELLEKMGQIDPALIVIEKKFVYLNDGGFLDEIRMHRLEGEVPIMIAGYEFTKDEAVDVIRKGADELLLLPFRAEHLSEKVSQLLHRKVAF